MKEALEKIGLSKREASVYGALVETGLSTTGPLVKKTGIPASKIYETLEKLISKGLVSMVVKKKTKHFSATNPERLLDYLGQKRKEIEKQEHEVQRLLPYLMEKRREGEEAQNAEVTFGFEGLVSLANKLIADAKEGDEYCFFSFYVDNPERFEKVFEFYRDFDYVRKGKGLAVKGIIPKKIRKITGTRRFTKICYVDFPVPTNISICNNKVLFTPWEDEEVTYLIYSKHLARSLKDYFHSIFDRYHPDKRMQGSKPETALYMGFNAVTGLFRDMLDELSAGESYYVIGAGYGEVRGLREFFYKHHKRRVSKRIRLMMLANHTERGKLVKTTSINSEVRFLPEYLITNMEIVIFKKRVFIAIWKAEPVAFVIEDEETVKSFKKYFQTFWKIASN